MGTTPLPGLGTPLAEVAANVQAFGGGELARQRPSSVASFLERNAASVAINSAQGNPFQPDVSYRGFTASPLLGVPQGLSVFQDGVRINEPFGDVVNWDLLPPAAIASIQIIPAAGAAFGPNTLGGTLAVYTKSGAQNAGGAVEAQGGSFGRASLLAEGGGAAGPWDYFVAGDALDDRGWAAHNPSRLRRLFAKVGHQTDRSDLDIALTLADNVLEGTQTLPVSFLDDIRQPYTFPDRNENRVAFLTAKGSMFVSQRTLVGGTAYWRRYRNDSFASNVNAEAGLADSPFDAPATNDRSRIDQSSRGAGVQATHDAPAFGGNVRLVAGASADVADVRFTRYSQPARFTPARSTEPLGDFVLDTDAATAHEQQALFAHASFAPGARWTFTLSDRYQVTRVRIEDRSGSDPRLDATHRFERWTPAAGAAFNPAPAFGAYASYNEGMRAPTPVELTCADPGAPCKLPNNFLADPALRPVVAKTWEAGLRGRRGEGTGWSVAIYRTDLDDDIQFVTSGASTAGYFQNVGRTRRLGAELSATAREGTWAFAFRYGYVDATFRSEYLESSPNNSTADASGAIKVEPGDRIPAIPAHTLKLRAEYLAGDTGSIGASLVAASAAYARGDENNRDAGGRVPGYAVVNLDARWQPHPRVEFFLQVDNLFDRRYATFAVLGRDFFTGPGRSFAPEDAIAEQFRGVGVPFGAWAGLRYRWR